MGILDALRGVKRPENGVVAQPRAALRQQLLGLNNDQVPFSVGASSVIDLEAEWKIVDAAWYEVFAKAGLEKSHRIYLRLDEDKHEVRALEEASTVAWEAGVPHLSLSVEKFQGRTLGSKEFGRAYAFTGVNPLNVGEVYNYRFDLSEMKDPIITTVTAAGWTFVPVTTKSKVKT